MTLDATQAEAFRSAVGGGKSVLISTHVNPDPDAIGSMLATREMILALGSHPRAIIESDVPVRCKMLPGAEFIEICSRLDPSQKFDVAVLVDCGGPERIGAVSALLNSGATVVNIDHHVSNNGYGTLNFVCGDCAATAEVLFLLCRELNIAITPSLANTLFAGLLTDTGRFRYPNTSARSLQIAADLAQAGAEITRVTDALYFDIAPADLLSMSAIYSTLEFFGDGAVSTLFARLDHLVEDPDTVVDLAASIRGVKVAALLSETKEGKIRVSLRSRNSVNVALVAESFGGGGHEKAAGFRAKGTLETVRERLIPVLLQALTLTDQHRVAVGS